MSPTARIASATEEMIVSLIRHSTPLPALITAI